MLLEGQEERGREGLGVGCVGMGGVCGREAGGGGGREGEGGVGDAGFVLPVAYVQNLNCCCLVCLDVFRHFHRTRKVF